MAVGAVGAVEGLEVKLLDRLDYEPGEVILWEPVAQVRRQQQRLVSVMCEEVLWHVRMVQNRPDSRGLCDSLREKEQWKTVAFTTRREALRFAGATGRPDLVLLVIRSRRGTDAIVTASPPVTRIG